MQSESCDSVHTELVVRTAATTRDVHLACDLSTQSEETRCVQYASARAAPENLEERHCAEDLHIER